MNKTPKDVDLYIKAAPAAARAMLKQIRATIRAAAPNAIEKLSYGMPYYGDNGRLVYFAAFREHVSAFVMISQATRAKYALALKRYQTGKATLQFPFGTKVPVALIAKLVRARVKENAERTGTYLRRG